MHSNFCICCTNFIPVFHVIFSIFKEKSSENKSNKYNQNFRGKYCTCKRPYPDPDDEIEDEMIQCVVCEDWYHSRHLGALPPADYSELICDACIHKLDFLRWYKSVSVSSHEISPGKALAKSRDNSNGTGHVGKSGICEGAPSSKKHDGFLGGESNKEEPITLDQQEAPKKEGPNEGEQPVKNCKLHSLKIGNEAFDDKASIQALFWPSHWRKILCKCAECKDLYNLKGAPFIINEEDTVSAYEEKGKKMHESNTAYDKGMRAFSSMDRINQVEVLTEYNDMKSQLHEFLGRFAGDGKVVTKEDIEEFFAGMKAKKRRRLDDGSTSFQYHCR